MPDFCELQEHHPQGSAKDTTYSEKPRVTKSAGGKHKTAAELPDLSFEGDVISLFLRQQVNSHPLFICLKSQHFQCVFGVENDHPTIGTARLFLRRSISFETELPFAEFCYLRQRIAWLQE